MDLRELEDMANAKPAGMEISGQERERGLISLIGIVPRALPGDLEVLACRVCFVRWSLCEILSPLVRGQWLTGRGKATCVVKCFAAHTVSRVRQGRLTTVNIKSGLPYHVFLRRR